MDGIWLKLLIVCPLVFIGAMVDAIAGGGGLITLPAYLLSGLPLQTAVGTNKFSAFVGSLTNAVRFIRGGAVQFPVALPAAGMSLLGAAFGTQLLLTMSERVIQVLLLILLPVLAFILFRGDGLGKFEKSDPGAAIPCKKALPLALVIGLVLGAYDGFFGPGTGTFLTIAFMFALKLDIRHAMGNTKLVNLASNLASCVTMLLAGRVVFAIGIPAAVCSLLGGYVGSGLALKNGTKVFKPIFGVVFCLLLVRVIGGLIG